MDKKIKVLGIKFKNNPKIYDFMAGDEKADIKDTVIVETAFGKEIGIVVYIDKEVSLKNQPTQKVLRKATEKDLESLVVSKKDRENLEKIFKEKTNKYNLDMKLVGIEFSIEDKIMFLFTAENRIDFRELVKDLTKSLKKQIRLKQIGPRDESRQLGGFGQCGRPLCCMQFMSDMESITMDMARNQNMAGKGSSKISGLCGRLMCCLSFESEVYKEMVKKLPKVGEKIKTKEGVGIIVSLSPLEKKAEVEFSDGKRQEIDL